VWSNAILPVAKTLSVLADSPMISGITGRFSLMQLVRQRPLIAPIIVFSLRLQSSFRGYNLSRMDKPKPSASGTASIYHKSEALLCTYIEIFSIFNDTAKIYFSLLVNLFLSPALPDEG
jgi:hypothetical protein